MFSPCRWDLVLICSMWVFSITHTRPLGRADWAFILGWRRRPECFNGRASSLGLASGLASPFFKPYQYPIKISFQINFLKVKCFIKLIN